MDLKEPEDIVTYSSVDQIIKVLNVELNRDDRKKYSIFKANDKYFIWASRKIFDQSYQPLDKQRLVAYNLDACEHVITIPVAFAKKILAESKFPFSVTKTFLTLKVECIEDYIEIKVECPEHLRRFDLTKDLARRAQRILECQFEMKPSPDLYWHDDIAYLYPDRMIKGHCLNISNGNLIEVKGFTEKLGIEIRSGSDEKHFYSIKKNLTELIKWEELIFPYHTGIAYILDNFGRYTLTPGSGSRFIKKVPEYKCSSDYLKFGIDSSEQMGQNSVLFIEYDSNVKGDFEKWKTSVERDFARYNEVQKKYKPTRIKYSSSYGMTEDEMNEATYWAFEGDVDLLRSHFDT